MVISEALGQIPVGLHHWVMEKFEQRGSEEAIFEQDPDAPVPSLHEVVPALQTIWEIGILKLIGFPLGTHDCVLKVIVQFPTLPTIAEVRLDTVVVITPGVKVTVPILLFVQAVYSKSEVLPTNDRLEVVNAQSGEKNQRPVSAVVIFEFTPSIDRTQVVGFIEQA